VADDDRVDPVLGFSFDENWDESVPLSPPLEVWLDGVRENVKKVKTTLIEAKVSTQESWDTLAEEPEAVQENRLLAKSLKKTEEYPHIKKIGPLLSSNWGQGKIHYRTSPVANPIIDYWNLFTPFINVKNTFHVHAPVGCGATAFGQIMNYYRWPKGIDATPVTYKINEYNETQEKIIEKNNVKEILPATVYKYTDENAARRLEQIGKVMGMRYKAEESVVAPAAKFTQLKKVFQYTSETGLLNKGKNEEAWHKKIKDDLDLGLPILYQGSTKGKRIGHIFVCDGYIYLQSKKLKRYYHFNWGWNGAYNMWTSLDSLTPSDKDYSDSQKAIFGFRPKNKLLRPIAASNAKVTNLDATGVTIKWKDNSSNESGFKIYVNGVLIAEISANSTQYRISAKKLKKIRSNIKSEKQLGDDYPLQSDSIYKVVVKAFNGAGESTDESSSTEFVTGKVAKLTSFFLRKSNNDYFLTFLWNKHDADKVHLKIIGYKKGGGEDIYYNNFASGTTKEVKIIPSEVTSITLSSYENNVYMGSRKYDFSSPLDLSPLKPEAPLVRVVRKSLTSATLRLSSSTASNFKIYKDNHFIALSSSEYTISNLEENTEYTYRIVTSNIWGDSQSSSFTFKT